MVESNTNDNSCFAPIFITTFLILNLAFYILTLHPDQLNMNVDLYFHPFGRQNHPAKPVNTVSRVQSQSHKDFADLSEKQ